MSTAARSHTSPRSLMAIRQGIPAGLYWGLAAFGLALPLLLWLLAAAGNVDPVFLPGPARVAERIQAWWDEGLLGDVGALAFRFAFGEVWSRPQLSRRDRSLCVIAILAALGQALAAGRRGEVDGLMAATAAYTGLRWGELAALTVDQIYPAVRVITVWIPAW